MIAKEGLRAQSKVVLFCRDSGNPKAAIRRTVTRAIDLVVKEVQAEISKVLSLKSPTMQGTH